MEDHLEEDEQGRKIKSLPPFLKVMVESEKDIQDTDVQFVRDLYMGEDKKLLNQYLRARDAQGLSFAEFVIALIDTIYTHKLMSRSDLKDYIVKIIEYLFESSEEKKIDKEEESTEELKAAQDLINLYDISLASLIKTAPLFLLISLFHRKISQEKETRDPNTLSAFINNYIFLSTKFGRIDFLDHLLRDHWLPVYEKSEDVELKSLRILMDNVFSFAKDSETIAYLEKFFSSLETK